MEILEKALELNFCDYQSHYYLGKIYLNRY